MAKNKHMTSRHKSSKSLSYTHTKKVEGTPASNGNPATPAVTQTKTVSVPAPSLPSVNMGGGGAQMVVIGMTVLLLFVSWNGFTKPILDTWWNGANLNVTIPFPAIVGAGVFIIVMAMIASSSSEGESIALLMMFGMWLIFLMFNGANQIAAVFKWFQSGSNPGTMGMNAPSTAQYAGNSVNPTVSNAANAAATNATAQANCIAAGYQYVNGICVGYTKQ